MSPALSMEEDEAASELTRVSFTAPEEELACQADALAGRASAVTRAPADAAAQTRTYSNGGMDIGAMIRQQMITEEGQLLDRAAGAGAASDNVSPGVRMVVVSWLVEVSQELTLQQETLHLSAVLFDRFLSRAPESVPQCVLQLLAIACVQIAAKEQEVVQPSVAQLCALTAHHYTTQDLLRMERIVLDTLEFATALPSAYTFLHLLAQSCVSALHPAVLSLAMFLLELALLDAGASAALPHSTSAVCALLLAQLTLAAGDARRLLPGVLEAMGGLVSLDDLTAGMCHLLELHQAAHAALRPHQALDSAAAAAATYADDLSEDADDLLAPVHAKFAADCWCGVSAARPLAALPPLAAWAACA